MIWMGDMPLSYEPTEMMIDPQSGSPFFNDSPHTLEEMRGRMPLVSGKYYIICLNGPLVCSCAIDNDGITAAIQFEVERPCVHNSLIVCT